MRGGCWGTRPRQREVWGPKEPTPDGWFSFCLLFWGGGRWFLNCSVLSYLLSRLKYLFDLYNKLTTLYSQSFHDPLAWLGHIFSKSWLLMFSCWSQECRVWPWREQIDDPVTNWCSRLRWEGQRTVQPTWTWVLGPSPPLSTSRGETRRLQAFLSQLLQLQWLVTDFTPLQSRLKRYPPSHHSHSFPQWPLTESLCEVNQNCLLLHRKQTYGYQKRKVGGGRIKTEVWELVKTTVHEIDKQILYAYHTQRRDKQKTY